MSARAADLGEQLEEVLHGSRILPVATLDDAAQADGVGRALVRGGVPCLEVTLRTDAALDALRHATSIPGLVAGAGTVLTPEQAHAAADAGARFAVAPGLDEPTVKACAELGLPFLPGIATASELQRARALGVRTVKVFPAAQLGGTAFLRALAAPFPDVRFVPTGGVSVANLAEYLALPSVVAVGGSWLVAADVVRAGRFGEVERLAREALARV
jgi:2-dehydro-3-deoxyphosphogluconate aldolase/(4S)-4-hydroxy-2-oxoglutarate aldolase